MTVWHNAAFAFRGWVQTGAIDTIEGVTHWTELPRPPKGAMT